MMSNSPSQAQPFFSTVHAPSVLRDGNGLKISRKPNTYNGLAFSTNTIQVGERITFIVESNDNCSGDLRLGVTTNDPANIIQLPKYSCPMLCGISGYWLAGVPGLNVEGTSKIAFYLTNNGCLQFFVDGNHKGAIHSKLPMKDSLWFVFDLFGRTVSLTCIKDDVVPIEVVARGPAAAEAYQQIMSSGCTPVYRTRLMICGPKSSGKTSVKNLLVRSSSLESDESADTTWSSEDDHIIDTSTKCVVGEANDGQNVSTWQKLVYKNAHEVLETFDNKYEEESSENFVLEYEKNLEEEYHKAIAKNMVRELLQQKKILEDKKRNSAGKARQLYFHRKTLSWRKNKVDSKKLISNDRKDGDCKLYSSELPDQIVEMVEKMIQEAEVKQDWDKQETEKPNLNFPSQINLNVWDWSGDTKLFIVQQLFFNARAVYLVVCDLSKNFEDNDNNYNDTEEKQSQGSYQSQIQFWLQAIYNHASMASKSSQSIEENVIVPKILLIGTHTNQMQIDGSNSHEKLVERKFQHLMENLKDKPYYSCIVNKMIALDICDPFPILEAKVSDICSAVEQILYSESYMGEEVPLSWLSFENSIAKLVSSGTYCTDLSMLKKIAEVDGIKLEENFKEMLQTFHDYGVLMYYGNSLGCMDDCLSNCVVLSPDWLMECFRTCLMLSPSSTQKDLDILETQGKLKTSHFSELPSPFVQRLPVILGLLTKFEFICEYISDAEIDADTRETYCVPVRVERHNDSKKSSSPSSINTVTFYYIFKGFVYDSTFGRLLTRTIKWFNSDFSSKFLHLSHHYLKLGIDDQHDLELQLIPPNRIKVTVIRVSNNNSILLGPSEPEYIRTNSQKKPIPEICAQVRHFLESSLEDIRVMWEKRMVFQACVSCWCSKECILHGRKSCSQETCQHFLLLDECLISKVVCCEYQRLKTADIQSWFPEIIKPAMKRNLKTSAVLGANNSMIRKPTWELDFIPNADLPVWANGAAKFLNAGSEGQDWAALAGKLGYKKKKIQDFQDDFNPASALISDWINSSGNTMLSTDMMLSCLEEMHCSEVIDLIKSATVDKDPPPVFISYQWDIQEEVLLIRNQLESNGYLCWMDVGQMGGGDLLYQQIYDGINNCKIMVSCVSPKYVVSNICSREVCLADALKKPIIPVMMETTSWPPPGAMGLIFSQLIYVSMCRNGGHGGSGKHSDWHSRMQEITLQVSRYVSPPASLMNNSFICINNAVGGKDMQFHVDEVRGVGASNADHQDNLLSDNVTSTNNNGAQPPSQFQRAVHVSNCSVCSIL